MKESMAVVCPMWYHGNKAIKKRVTLSSIRPVRKFRGRQGEEKAGSAAGALTLTAASWSRLFFIGSGQFHAQISKTSSR